MTPRARRWTLRVLTLIFAGALAVACSSGDDEPTPGAGAGGATTTPTATATATPTEAPPTVTPTATATQDPGAACPVDRELCDIAESILPLLAATDVDALLALGEPIATTCPSGGFGGPSSQLCEGASAGEVRLGYWDVQGGEGVIVSEAEFRRTLARWFRAIDGAAGSDSYGRGELPIGSIRCGRPAGTSSGPCLPSESRVHFTFINGPDADRSNGTGGAGERMTFHVSLHHDDAGALRVDGVGTIAPPNSVLEAFSHAGITADGTALEYRYYPWHPAPAAATAAFTSDALGLQFDYPRRLNESAYSACRPAEAGGSQLAIGANVTIDVAATSGATLDAAVTAWLAEHNAEGTARSDVRLDSVDAIRAEYRLPSGRFGIVTIGHRGDRAYTFVFEPRNLGRCGETSPVELYELLLASVQFVP